MGIELKDSVRFALLISACCAILQAGPARTDPEEIVNSYCAVTRDQQQILNGASMDVEIDASLPKLKKYGRLHALRRISDLGRITYEKLRFDGDGTVKNYVIARYLSAETDPDEQRGAELAITPENYNFKYKGLKENEGRNIYVFEVSPHKKKVGLFKGELWIDTETYLRVRESGRFVKNPSIFLKKIEFVRTYEIRDGVSVPRQIHSTVDTRLVGKAELTIDYTNIAFAESPNRQVTLVDVDGQ